MKKLLSIILTVAMVFSMAAVSAFADETNPQTTPAPTTKGTITITAPAKDSVYNIYRIFDIQSHSDNYDSLAYRVSDKWVGFFAEGSQALNYVSIDANGAVTKKTTFTVETAPQFAKLAIEYAKANNIVPDNGTTDNAPLVSTGADVVFSGLELGYYLVDTSVGAFCGLTNTQPTATVKPKNVAPTMHKKVEEDSTGEFGETNTADLFQTVKFRVTIDAQKGAENYIYHDIMGEGLTLDEASIEVFLHKDGVETPEEWVKGLDYTVHMNCEHDDATCTFGIELSDVNDAKLTTGDYIYITYSATLVDVPTDENGNHVGVKNTGWLSYGDKHETTKSTTTTYAYGFDVVKTDAGNPATMLDGAEFELYEEATDATPIKFFKLADNKYRRATKEEVAAGTATSTIKVKLVDGKAVANIFGLDNDDYYLKETKNPDGYNAMVGLREIIVNNADILAVFDDAGAYSANTGIQVINSKGAVLPQTGGTGTMMFVVFGTIAVLGAGVLLVTKKRMAMLDD